MIIKGKVTHEKGKYGVANAEVALVQGKKEIAECPHAATMGVSSSRPRFQTGSTSCSCELFGITYEQRFRSGERRGLRRFHRLRRPSWNSAFWLKTKDGKCDPAIVATADKRLIVHGRVSTAARTATRSRIYEFRWRVRPEVRFSNPVAYDLDLVAPDGPRQLEFELTVIDKKVAADACRLHPISTGEVVAFGRRGIQKVEVSRLPEPIGVRLHRTQSDPTLDQALWVAIRNRTFAISFNRYQEFMNRALAWEERTYQVPNGIDQSTRNRIQRDLNDLGTHLHGVKAYQTMKLLTEAFLLVECGVRIEGPAGLRRGPGDFDEEAFRLGSRSPA